MVDLRSYVPETIPRSAKFFILASAINGVANGIFNVIIQLYYVTVGFDSSTLGDLFMMNPLGAAIFTIPAGILADRYGKRKVMMVGWAFSLTAFSIVITSYDPVLLRIAFFLFGLNNATSVVMSPIYSGFYENGELDRAFGLLGFVNIMMMSVGSLMGHIPPMLVSDYGLTKISAYWWVLLAGITLAIGTMPIWYLSIRGIPDPKAVDGFKIVLRSRSLVAKSTFFNFVSGVGTGVFFSLFPYFVNVKYGVESDALGNLFMAANFAIAGAQFVAPRISKRFGNLRTSSAAILLATPIYFMFPFAPDFRWISTLYFFRFGVGNVASPLMRAFFMGNLDEEEKSTASSITAMGAYAGGFLSPWLGGRLMKVSLGLPIWVGACLYAVFAATYYPLMRSEERKREKVTAVE